MGISYPPEFKPEELKLIVGLGNPGKQYKQTRHNAGFEFMDRLTYKLSLEFQENAKFKALEATWEKPGLGKVILVKPLTFMNLSGESIQKYFTFYKFKPEEILIAHDDLDIELGSTKIQLARGPKEHNGLKSLNSMLGTEDYWRARIGVESRTATTRGQISGRDYVLMKMTSADIDLLRINILEVISLF